MSHYINVPFYTNVPLYKSVTFRFRVYLHIPSDLEPNSLSLNENPILNFLEDESIVKPWDCNGLAIKENLSQAIPSGDDKLL